MPKRKDDPTELLHIFAERLITVRQTRGLSQSELGEIVFGARTRSNTNQVGEWERSKRLPHVHRLAALAKACEVSVDWLLGLAD